MRAAVLIVCLLATTARADEPWYRGEHGTNRVVHLSIALVGIVSYPLATPIEDGVPCRWCGGPNIVDSSARDLLLWAPDNRRPVARMSDLTAYVLAPGISTGLVVLGTIETPTTAALIDDVVPIFEAMALTQWVTRAIKIGVGRTRPDSRFADDPTFDEANLSFPSGHTSRAFAFATSAGVIARARGYRSEPYVWGFGLTLAAASGYLRIAADRHYLTDVVVGAALGVSAGLTVPLLMRRGIEVAPTGSGIAFAGSW